ncbi:thioredoxin domain-containing protein [Actinomyces sp. zg-332]|uniref:DsbA family protein n=1 Tax=Actinomyces sp. zg-332 TaxID=2708340 RepID=UPI0014215E63|nr:thioredoxin domain-containing protein [Actinomyces sp. zg-332]QPK93983.1 thioredoxin domain-containing protein [Actinomyces sp. zg-332]
MAGKKRVAGSIIAAVIVVLILVVGVALYYVYSSKSSNSSTANGIELAKTGYSDPADYEAGKGIYLSSKGVDVLDKNLPTFEIYMDYTCVHCVHFEKKYSKEISELVKSGKMNVIYRPVNVLQQDYSKYVSSAVIEVLKSADKDKFFEFHSKLTENVADYFDTKDESKITLEYIDKLAKEAGISDETIAKFKNTKYDKYIDTTLERWMQRPLFKGESIGTPTFVLDGKVVSLADIENAGSLAKFIEANK